MPRALQGLLSVVGRVLLIGIFLMSALGNKIPNFHAVADPMAKKGVPSPQFLLVGAIAFLIVGSVTILLGYWARVGALLLLIFLILATYYFHDFWNITDAQAQQEQMAHFLKNVSLMGAMLLIIANGTGAWSLDNRSQKPEVGA